LSKGYNTGTTEYIELEKSANDKGFDQKGNMCMLPILKQLPPLLLPDFTLFTALRRKFELNKKMLCACKLSK